MEDIKIKNIEISEGDVLLAATLINDAKSSRNMSFKTDPQSVKSYILYQHWCFKWILHICLWCNLALAVFEKPAVEHVAVPYWGTIIMELFFLGYFFFRFFHHMHFDVPAKFWKDPKNITTLAILILTIIDIIAYVIWKNVASPDVAEKAVRWSRVLRPFLLVNFPEGRQIRKAFRNIRKTVPDILHVLVLFLCSLAIFSLMALKILQQRKLSYSDGSPYFQDYFDSYWDLYVLVTTANNPDVMMPAYDHNRWFAAFFVVFTVLNQYIFMSIILASVYNNYKRHLKDEVRSTVLMKRELLSQAFDLLKVQTAEGHEQVPSAHWHAVMAVVAPQRSTTQCDLLLYVLDEDGNNSIDRKHFLQVADLLNVKLTEIKDRMTRLEKQFPGCFNSKPSELLRTVVRHRGFRYFFDFAILVNAICIGLSLEQAEWFFLALFTVEICLKLYTYGPVKFFRSAWNIFDFVVILAAGLATFIETLNGHYSERGRTLDFILVLRVLRLIRLIGSIERFQIIITTIVNIGPSILTYGGVIFVLFYVYAIIGMEVFQGLIKYYDYNNLTSATIYCGNANLNGSEFFTKRYCNNNFNDIARSFVVLFDLMVVNQWHVLTQGFVLVTHKAVRLYFITFHMVCVVLLLNIFTAFVLEVFLLEYSLSGNALEDSIETKIKQMGLSKGLTPVGRRVTLDKLGLVDQEETDTDGLSDTDISVEPKTTANGPSQTNTAIELQPPGVNEGNALYFKLKRKTKKRLEDLLQAMFKEEIEAEDALKSNMPGTAATPDASTAVRPRRVTLETIDL